MKISVEKLKHLMKNQNLFFWRLFQEGTSIKNGIDNNLELNILWEYREKDKATYEASCEALNNALEIFGNEQTYTIEIFGKQNDPTDRRREFVIVPEKPLPISLSGVQNSSPVTLDMVKNMLSIETDKYQRDLDRREELYKLQLELQQKKNEFRDEILEDKRKSDEEIRKAKEQLSLEVSAIKAKEQALKLREEDLKEKAKEYSNSINMIAKGGVMALSGLLGNAFALPQAQPMAGQEEPETPAQTAIGEIGQMIYDQFGDDLDMIAEIRYTVEKRINELQTKE